MVKAKSKYYVQFEHQEEKGPEIKYAQSYVVGKKSARIINRMDKRIHLNVTPCKKKCGLGSCNRCQKGTLKYDRMEKLASAAIKVFAKKIAIETRNTWTKKELIARLLEHEECESEESEEEEEDEEMKEDESDLEESD